MTATDINGHEELGMRVFITGASGHIGSAVVPDLLAAGHQVIGLARSDASAAALAAAGAEVLRGDIDDTAGLGEAARSADGVIHLAFKHEAMRSGGVGDAIAADRRALEAMGEAVSGTGKPLVSTSGTLLLAQAGLGRPGTERDIVPGGGRVDAENYVIELAGQGVRSAAIRLPPTVHSTLDRHGFIPTLISIARASGVAAYIGDGANRWPAGHTLDGARLYRLAVESAPAGSRLHAVGDEGVPFRDIAAMIGRQLNVPVVSIEPEQADAHFGFLGPLAGLDNPTSSALTQELLGWRPEHPGLLADMAESHYFAAEPAAQ